MSEWLWEMIWVVFQEVKTEQPHNSAILFLGIYPKPWKSVSINDITITYIQYSCNRNSQDVEKAYTSNSR